MHTGEKEIQFIDSFVAAVYLLIAAEETGVNQSHPRA